MLGTACRAVLAVVVAALLLAVSACGDGRGPAMVSTANPHASTAAIEILRRGGSAIDAAIAAQLVLGLVEPQSSGLGGGAFLLHWDAGSETVEAYDGRETAPAAARPDLFLKPDGTPMPFMEAVVGGRAVGVPGLVAMLAMAHRDHGVLDWASLFEPAIELAETGFTVSPRLHAMISAMDRLAEDPAARAYFYADTGPGVSPLPVGHRLRNPAYARTLRIIAEQGPEGFYHGEIAEAIVAAVTGHANPGAMTLEDLAGYEAKKREPVCRPYRGYRVCGMPPPSSGGLTTAMILGLLEPFALPAMRPGSPTTVHLISEASRLAYADRARYMADSDFVTVPVEVLTDPRYIADRARLIHPGRSMGVAEAGRLDWQTAPAKEMSRASTTHLAIVDGRGNAVSLTSSIEGPFGAHVMAAGFLLNNQLTDFSFVPERNGMAVANAVAGGKRPRSSMAPTLVFAPDGGLFAALGSPGGSRIIAYVAQTLVGLIDWGLPMQEAIDLPRHVNRNGVTELEAGTTLAGHADALRALGHEVEIRPLTSGLHGIRLTAGGMDGGADRRREGVVMTFAE